MSVTVKYFASMRDKMGRGDDVVDLGGASVSVAELWKRVADGVEMLNKPADEEEAWLMLCQLRGHTHQVHSGVIVIGADGVEHTIVNSSDVIMRPYTDEEIAAYIATGDPMDKAGAYAIQHPEFRPGLDTLVCHLPPTVQHLCNKVVGGVLVD